MKNEAAKKSDMLRRILALVVTLALVAVGVLAFVYKDALNAQTLKRLFGRETEAIRSGEPYAYESGAKQTFAMLGDCLAVVSATGAQLLGKDGYTVTRLVFPMSTPAAASGGHNLAVYDVGGTALRVISENGQSQELDTKEKIISVTVTNRGYISAITERSGTKGLVTVFDDKLGSIFEWHSGLGYALTSRVSPDSKSLAVVTATGQGGRIVILDMETGEELGAFISHNELFFDAVWISASALCVISEARAVFLETDGTQSGEYGFDGEYLACYDLGADSQITLLLCKYRTGSEGRLVSVGKDARELGTLDVDGEIVSMSGAGGVVAVLWADTVALYKADSLELKGETERPPGVKELVVRSDGKVLLLMPYSAQICEF